MAASVLSGVSAAISKNQAVEKEQNNAGSSLGSGYHGMPASDYLETAKELSSQETQPDENGAFYRVRLIETDMKYPYLRVEELIEQDQASGEEVVLSREAAVADHMIVKLKDGLGAEDLDTINRKYGCETRKVMGAPGLYLVKLPTLAIDSLPQAIAQYQQETSTISIAEPDFVVQANELPNDPKYTELWGLSQANDCDIDAPEAWELATEAADVVVGVIDTGIDYNHEDLAANIWTNAGEIAGNGLDDDGNGYVDDVRGWDFYNNDNDPFDDHYHGTHVAGTIGAVGNNGLGVVGVCWKVKLMALKFLSAYGYGYSSDAAEAVDYATRLGVKLTSNSWGGGGYSQALKDAIDAAGAANSLFVAAAGNSARNNDLSPHYPSSYNSANLIAVAATDQDDALAYFSNYGATSVDLAAPGVSILSTIVASRNYYGRLSGTSMATPHVSGACALLMAYRQSLTALEVKETILGSVDSVTSLAGKVASGGRLNLQQALKGLAINNASGATEVTTNSATLRGKLITALFENPQVLIYWGKTDGGANASAWEKSVDLGVREKGAFATAVSGLDSVQTYYYRCYASNSLAQAWASASTTWQTYASELPAPTGVSASDGTYSYIVRVNWNAIPGAGGYEVWRGTNTDIGLASKLTKTSGIFYDDSSVSYGTPYYYWLKATNPFCSSPFSVSDVGYAGFTITVQFSTPFYSVNEEAGTVTLTVTRTGISFGPASVDYATSNGAARAGTDYTSTSGTLTWAEGDISSKTITIPIANDTLKEENETFKVLLSNLKGLGYGAPIYAIVTIVDNDHSSSGVLQFATASTKIGEAARSVTLQVTRTGGNYGSASVEYMTKDGTASAGSDYSFQSGALSWPDGDSSSKTITVVIIDDLLNENDETFTVKLFNAQGAVLGPPSYATVTIQDNDSATAGVIKFAASSTKVGEDRGPITLLVMRTGGNYGPASVEYVTTDGTASAGSDYSFQSGTLSWTDGDSSSKPISVSITDDSIHENNETFTVMLSNAAGVVLGQPSSATVTILDNDNASAGVIQFAETSIEVGEADGFVSLKVVRKGGSSGEASAEYITANGTAKAGLDYDTVKGRLHWGTGDDSPRMITVPIRDDPLAETNEDFIVGLYNVKGFVSIGSRNALVSIIDNDSLANLADLEISGFKWVPPKMRKLEHPTVISLVLRNNGPASLQPPDSTLEIRFYLSGNLIFGDEDDLWVGTKPGDVTLAAGDELTLRYAGLAQNSDVTIPEGISGDYYVFVSIVHVSPSGLIDPDGASAMRKDPITIEQPSPGDKDDGKAVPNDYDADGLSDMVEYDEESGEWLIQLSASGTAARFAFGGPDYEIASGDYDGDGLADPAVHQQNGPAWQIMLSGLGYETIGFDFGADTETRGVVGDYNKDRLADPGLYEEQTGRWYVFLPDERGSYAIASAVFGGPGYLPAVGDYDGDGRADPALYEEATGNWLIMLSAQGYSVQSTVLGGPGYRPVPGDYDGDGKTDLAIMSADGGWYYRLSGHGYALSGPDEFGQTGYPVPGDYDGDGKADPAVVSASGGWYF